eukprot:scaffold693_cov399-Prasinococcus_capsulatus_cf.AAC.30
MLRLGRLGGIATEQVSVHRDELCSDTATERVRLTSDRRVCPMLTPARSKRLPRRSRRCSPLSLLVLTILTLQCAGLLVYLHWRTRPRLLSPSSGGAVHLSPNARASRVQSSSDQGSPFTGKLGRQPTVPVPSVEADVVEVRADDPTVPSADNDGREASAPDGTQELASTRLDSGASPSITRAPTEASSEKPSGGGTFVYTMGDECRDPVDEEAAQRQVYMTYIHSSNHNDGDTFLTGQFRRLRRPARSAAADHRHQRRRLALVASPFPG